MSASREKKKRQNGDPAEVVEASVSQKGMSKTVKKVLIAIVAVVVVAAIVFLGMVSTGFFAKHGTAAVAAGHKLTPAMVNYYYQGAYSQMSQFLSYIIDKDVPLSEQAYSEDMSWADFLMESALSTAASTYAVYDEAVANGYTISEEGQSSIDSTLAMYETYATINGFSSADAMLVYNFGNGCNTKSYREYLTVNTIATEYAQSIGEGFTYSQEDIDTYYGEHAEDFDGVTYRSFNVSIPSDTEEDQKEAALADCEATAKAIAEAADSEEAFTAQVQANVSEDQAETYADPDATLRKDVTKASAGEEAGAWLFDAARQYGDTTYVKNGETGYTVLFFMEQADHSYLLPNISYMRFSVSDSTDEAAMATAKQNAQQTLDTFLAGEQTESAFTALVETQAASGVTGGHNDNLTRGSIGTEVEDWAYDAGRAVGDTQIIETSTGYYVVYFSGYGRPYQDYTVEATMRQNDYNAWYEGVTSGASYTTNGFIMRFTTN